MRKYALPSCIDSLNIKRDDVAFAAYYHAMCNSSAIESEDEAARLRESLKYVWELTKND